MPAVVLPFGAPPRRERIAVIGAGEHGQAFTARCLRAGYHVTLEDVLSSNLRQAERRLGDAQQGRAGRLELADTVEDAVRQADIAIDFVPDELESKLEILCLMDRMAPPRTLFCTPTTLSISDLASCTYRAPSCVAVRPFRDEPQERVVLVPGRATSDDTVVRLRSWLVSLELSIEVVLEGP